MSAGTLLLIASPFIGSWLATLAVRLPEGEPTALVRSRCRSCGQRLAPRDLVPLLSWLVLRGRCRYCGGAIGAYYPLVELAALALAAAAVAVESGPFVLITCCLGWALLALALCDLRAFLLPDAIVLPLIPCGLAVAAFTAPEPGGTGAAIAGEHVVGAALGYAVFAALGWAYRALRKREGLGAGDAKLMAAAGAWLGWQPLPLLVMLAAGMALAGTLLAHRTLALGPLRMQKVPFGAPLAAAIFLFWLGRSWWELYGLTIT
jgi:leader peptidase (prepilin peptidase) / N-methyltransferase